MQQGAYIYKKWSFVYGTLCNIGREPLREKTVQALIESNIIEAADTDGNYRISDLGRSVNIKNYYMNNSKTRQVGYYHVNAQLNGVFEPCVLYWDGAKFKLNKWFESVNDEHIKDIDECMIVRPDWDNYKDPSRMDKELEIVHECITELYNLDCNTEAIKKCLAKIDKLK